MKCMFWKSQIFCYASKWCVVGPLCAKGGQGPQITIASDDKTMFSGCTCKDLSQTGISQWSMGLCVHVHTVWPFFLVLQGTDTPIIGSTYKEECLQSINAHKLLIYSTYLKFKFSQMFFLWNWAKTYFKVRLGSVHDIAWTLSVLQGAPKSFSVL